MVVAPGKGDQKITIEKEITSCQRKDFYGDSLARLDFNFVLRAHDHHLCCRPPIMPKLSLAETMRAIH